MTHSRYHEYFQERNNVKKLPEKLFEIRETTIHNKVMKPYIALSLL